MTISLYNTLTRQKDALVPENEKNVRMYVCGPTVYDRAHLGNARSVVVYDVLYRLLRHVYGEKQVTYVRNITDVDDKINKAAVERGITIQQLTQEVTGWFHADMEALNCLELPEKNQPRATQYIKQMIKMIESLIANGNAYVAEGHVLFDVNTSPSRGEDGRGALDAQSSQSPHPNLSPTGVGNWYYGMLSGRSLDDLIAGARVEVAPYKKSPGDFVLWKPAAATDDASSKFESPWGVGRPGWHIECSAMATELLGDTFDIHGGGADLMFPHHENEIAQACAANPGSRFAKMWVHNGFLTVHGEKMSKSLGNFITVRDLLDKGVHGEVIRFALLSTHYRKPLDWTDKLVEEAFFDLKYFAQYLWQNQGFKFDKFEKEWKTFSREPEAQIYLSRFYESLESDLNFSVAKTVIYDVIDEIKKHVFNLEDKEDNQENEKNYFIYRSTLREMCEFLGLCTVNFVEWQKQEEANKNSGSDVEAIQNRIGARKAAKLAKNWAEADRIRDELKAEGILLEDKPGDVTEWRRL
ncbi:MAG: cysteine--tRNA ligase [Rickettsiales bacterium]